MQKTITVLIKSVYGRELFYPVCENAKRFAQLTKSKTLLESDLLTLQLIGFDIKIETPEFKTSQFVKV